MMLGMHIFIEFDKNFEKSLIVGLFFVEWSRIVFRNDQANRLWFHQMIGSQVGC